MDVIRWTVLAVSAAVCVVALAALWRLWRGRREGEWLRGRMAGFCDAADGAGISLLYTGIRDAGEAAELLAEEYARYEVIVVADSETQAPLLEELKRRYALAAVDYRPGTELPVFGVRGLYRSQSRGFRRLVLIDRERSAPTDDWDAAAEVASFDWLLPLRAGERLLPTGLCRLAAEVNRDARRTVRVVTSTVGVPALMIAWEELAAIGGFSPRLLLRVHRSHRRQVGEAVLRSVVPPPGGRPRFGVAALAVVWAAGGYGGGGGVGLAGCLCGWLLVWVVARAAAPYVAPLAGPVQARREAWRWLLRKFTVKKFTLS